jgi:hypothetical protein
MYTFHFSVYRSQQRSQPRLHVIGLSHLSWRNSQNRQKNTRIKTRFIRPRSAQNIQWLYLNASACDRTVPRTWPLGIVDSPILLRLRAGTRPSCELGINSTHLKFGLVLRRKKLDTHSENWRFLSGECVTVAVFCDVTLQRHRPWLPDLLFGHPEENLDTQITVFAA